MPWDNQSGGPWGSGSKPPDLEEFLRRGQGGMAPAFGSRIYRLQRGAGLVAGGYRVAQLLLQRAAYAALCRFIE